MNICPDNTGWLSFGHMNKGSDRSGMRPEHFRSSEEVLNGHGKSGCIKRILPVQRFGPESTMWYLHSSGVML